METLPRIYTARLLDMADGDVLDLGDGCSITCLDSYRSTFRFDDDTEYFNEPVFMAHRDGVWYQAQWNDRNNQYTSGDLLPEYTAVYAFARRLTDLWGVRTYKSAGVLIRAEMRRRPYV